MPKEIQPLDDLRTKIQTIRGLQVMLDKDLANLYGTTPIRLRQQVKRNSGRFPDDFMFKLNGYEVESMVSQNVIPSRSHFGGSLPYAFTEHGVASLSGVLTSPKAVEVYIGIMRTFVELRRKMHASTGITQRIDTVEKRQLTLETKVDLRFEQVFNALEGPDFLPRQGVYFDGQIHDAHSFASNLIRSARKSIILIDNYIDDTVLTMLSKRKTGVTADLFTKSISKSLALDLSKHNVQYPPIRIREFSAAHDRFLILDGKTVYHIGASLKDLGKKWFAFSRIENDSLKILDRLPPSPTPI
jgi:hypothetical protein